MSSLFAAVHASGLWTTQTSRPHAGCPLKGVKRKNIAPARYFDFGPRRDIDWRIDAAISGQLRLPGLRRASRIEERPSGAREIADLTIFLPKIHGLRTPMLRAILSASALRRTGLLRAGSVCQSELSLRSNRRRTRCPRRFRVPCLERRPRRSTKLKG